MICRWNILRFCFYLLTGGMALALGWGLVSGCRTISAGGIPAIEVTLASDGTAQFGADIFPIKELPQRLMSEGAGRETAVFLMVPPGMTQSAMAGILRDLQKAGFQKAIFKRPLKPDASINYQGGFR